MRIVHINYANSTKTVQNYCFFPKYANFDVLSAFFCYKMAVLIVFLLTWLCIFQTLFLPFSRLRQKDGNETAKGNAFMVPLYNPTILRIFAVRFLWYSIWNRVNMDFLDQLNESQRAAVEYIDGPELVIAGAGSGKTRVLTYKIAYLLQMGVRASNILALTFTNKAAREMKERIARLVPAADARYLWMGTFHSVCARLLRTEAERLGFTRDFSIYDTADSKSLLKQILKEQQLDEKIYKVGNVLGRISAAKNMLVSPDEYARNRDFYKADSEARMYKMAEVYQSYQVRLKAANAMDFDDLLININALMEQDAEVRDKYQQAFQYVLVDEYQDTNYVQYLLVKHLAEPQNRICVVGDDAQSIYSFRGADIRNILGFQRDYPHSHLYKLERNYRSTQTIVNAANSLIHHNEHQIPKEVYSEKEEGQRIDLNAYMSDRDEGEAVAKAISKDHTLLRRDYNDMAILYRTNAQSRAFENELRKRNIPYRIYGGTSFYQRKEIKDAIAYFRLAVNPLDNEALLRVINFPSRGIGDTTLRKVSDTAIIHGISMMDVVTHPLECSLPVQGATAKKLVLFSDLIARLREAAETKDAYEFAEMALGQSGVRTAAMLDRTPEGIDRAENLQELLNGIHEFVDKRTEEGVSFTPITDFLAEVSLLTDQDENLADRTSRVTLMTIHAAKGLEFPIVYIVGMEENLFPSQYCVKPSEIEEERRLLYVAITRAMEQCHLSYARQRFRNGQVTFTSPSRFLNDIDRHYLEVAAPQVAQPLYDRPRWGNNTWTDDDDNYTKPTFSKPLKPVKAAMNIGQIADTDYPSGSRVYHRVFGEGTVQRVYCENDNDKIDILFDTKGQKTLLLTYAKLEKR